MDLFSHRKRDFTILGLIESGCYGSVYKAIDHSTGLFLAAKFASEKDKNKGYTSFKKEVAVQLRLDHKNIVRMVCFFNPLERSNASNADLTAFLLMEHCECDLRTILTEYLVPPKFSKTICKQVLTALAYMETHQVLHCDLKPENLLLASDGNIKLCDFGSARYFNSDYPACGYTLAYCPPEILMGATVFKMNSDAWSLGCILAELYTGEILFDGSSKNEGLRMIFEICGSSPLVSWIEIVPSLPHNEKIKWPEHYEPTLIDKLMPKVNDINCMGLIEGLLRPHPDQRWNCRDALSSTYFGTPPEAAPLDEIVHLMSMNN